MYKLFKLDDFFEIKGKGLALAGIADNKELTLPAKTNIIFAKKQNSDFLPLTLLDAEYMRNCWSSHKPRNMILLVAMDEFTRDLERGVEIWCSPAEPIDPDL
ncbi:hypothetical protein ACO0LD_19760 [Undibacterium sp. Ji83W]|uniref:hypothetical protein n=1 Tax=Undibacterium sp. Ji83W TaxID=3413043 RepID=UPI003BEFBDAA